MAQNQTHRGNPRGFLEVLRRKSFGNSESAVAHPGLKMEPAKLPMENRFGNFGIFMALIESDHLPQ